ncbi:glycosyltransferase family 25 protein [Basilea psittacipulmonis]|uniref:glycosyltransferase family 25 protein n=1 Tax=Basilea psittacipulmonis TaxID=1472345 RepID=UPI0013013787|nr:glycosyltransferase family 25 protein [Basilea psittacipulmonis]
MINLKKSTHRRSEIQEQFQRINRLSETPITFEFFDAVYGKEQPHHPLFKKYNDAKRFFRKGNHMNLGQLGCFASHYLLWEKCVTLNMPMIVLEDDIYIQDNFTEIYSYLNSLDNTFEFMWLAQARYEKFYRHTTLVQQYNEKISIQRCHKNWENTMGYYLTPQAAQKLLNYAQ